MSLKLHDKAKSRQGALEGPVADIRYKQMRGKEKNADLEALPRVPLPPIFD